jgi:hypothetical protein
MEPAPMMAVLPQPAQPAIVEVNGTQMPTCESTVMAPVSSCAYAVAPEEYRPLSLSLFVVRSATTAPGPIVGGTPTLAVGDRIIVSWQVPGTGSFVLLDIPPGGVETALPIMGDAFDGRITPPTGLECVRGRYTEGSVIGVVQLCFTVVPMVS